MMKIGDVVGRLARETSIVEQTEALCLTAGQWHPITVQGGQRDVAQDELAAAGFPVYAPMLWVREPHGQGGGQRLMHRPMFGPYVFVRALDQPEMRSTIATRRGVGDIIRFAGDGAGMAVIDDLAIHVMRMVEWENFSEYQSLERQVAEDAARAAEEAQRRKLARDARELDKFRRTAAKKITWTFSPGDLARIKSGPFAGFNAQLMAAVDEQGRIAALVGLFGGAVKASISAFDLEKL